LSTDLSSPSIFAERPKNKKLRDSRNLLSVVLAGDGRLNTKLHRDEPLALGGRTRNSSMKKPPTGIPTTGENNFLRPSDPQS
jgi:hypothetical protein